MPPIRNYKDHDWTDFEMHTMLCLIIKGVHLEERGKRSDTAHVARNNAYVTFATELNKALHGENYAEDISKREVARMLDHVLLKHKGIVGKGGLTERQFGGRVTRALSLAFLRSRTSPIDYDGSVSEWNQWRRERERQKWRVRLGLPVENLNWAANRQDGADQQAGGSPSRGMSGGQTQKQKAPGKNRWRSRANALSDGYVDEADQGKMPAMVSDTIVQTNLDAFRTLPANLRSSSKFQWANPDARQTAFLSGRGGRAAIAAFQTTESYHPGVEFSQGVGANHGHNSFSRNRPAYETYLPPNTFRLSGSGHRSGMVAAKHRGGSDTALGLTHDYSSSDGINASGYAPITSADLHPRQQSSSSVASLDLNDGHADALAKGLGSEIASRRTAARHVASTKISSDGLDVEMGDLEEGEI